MAERIMIFIDGSNLYHSLKHYFKRTDIDVGKFCRKLQDKRQLIRIYYYNATVGQKEEPERYRHQQSFFASVNAVPYTELRLGRLVYHNWPNTPPYEKGTDVQLATDMITHNYKDNYDVAILVAGDNDYVGAVQAVKDNGKHCEIALFGKEGTSQQLRDAADKIVTLNSSFLKGCWKPTQPSPQSQASQQSQLPQTSPQSLAPQQPQASQQPQTPKPQRSRRSRKPQKSQPASADKNQNR